MTKDQIVQVLVAIDTKIDKLNKIGDMLKTLDNLEACPGYVSLGAFDEVHFHVKNMEEVHRVRTYLRGQFGTWKDHLNMIWHSFGANATWKGKTGGSVTADIWLSCPIKDFPQELLKDGCGFREVQTTETEFVCNRNKA